MSTHTMLATVATCPSDPAAGGATHTTTCHHCGRTLTRPTPDGYGPVCRRNLRTQQRTRGDTTIHPINHTALAETGQLTFI